MRYDWNVSTTKAWMNLLAPLARPAFTWNHRILMHEGGKSIARLLNAPLLHSEESMKHARTDAVLPAALLLLLAAYLATRLRGRRGRRPHAIASGREHASTALATMFDQLRSSSADRVALKAARAR